ncbi:hypothetical protein ACFVTT_38025 [Streptomyces niveus]|uniref:hypothetical protein n=1 Tax=Streptomyces niveus TaxID=193462 RepID=UPI00343633F5
MSAFQIDEPEAGRLRPKAGSRSLVLGILAVAMFGCPWLPSFVSHWFRFVPVYFIVPVGIGAIVSGVGALRAVRGEPLVDRRRAWGGVVLGSVAVVVPLGLVVWGLWALSNTKMY